MAVQNLVEIRSVHSELITTAQTDMTSLYMLTLALCAKSQLKFWSYCVKLRILCCENHC